MTWENIKQNIYYSDGSLRDIYVLNSTRADWEKWINYINENYEVKFIYYNDEGKEISNNKIAFQKVTEYWENTLDSVLNAEFLINKVVFKCYFFDVNEIENDIWPNDVNNIEQHNSIVEYLKSVSKLLNKEVILTPEGYTSSDKKYIIVNNEEVLIPSL